MSILSELSGYKKSNFFVQSKNDGKALVDLFSKPLSYTVLDRPVACRLKSLVPQQSSTLASGAASYEFTKDASLIGECVIQVKLSTLETTGAKYVDYVGNSLIKTVTVYTNKNDIAVQCDNFIDWVNLYIDKLPASKKAAILECAGGQASTGGYVLIPLGFVLWWSQLQQGGKTEFNHFPAFKCRDPLRINITWNTATSILADGTDTPTFVDTPTLYYYDYSVPMDVMDQMMKMPYQVKALYPEFVESPTAASADTELNVDISGLLGDYNSLNIICRKTADITAKKYFTLTEIDKKVFLYCDRQLFYEIANNNGTDSAALLMEFEKFMHVSRLVASTSKIHEIRFGGIPEEPNKTVDNVLGLLHGNQYKQKIITLRLTGASEQTYNIKVAGLAHCIYHIDERGQLVKVI